MRELTPETITDAVLDQMATTPDPRLKAIMASPVKVLRTVTPLGYSIPTDGPVDAMVKAQARHFVFGSSGDLAVDVVANDPDCPVKGMPSIRFDMRLSRESAADKTSGRVGADPSTMMKKSARSETVAAGAG